LRHWKKSALLAAWLLLAAALLGGCAQQLEARPLTDVSGTDIIPGMDAPAQDEIAGSRQRVLLYFFSGDGAQLEPVSREIDVPGGVSVMRAALEALLGGPLDGEDGIWPDLGLPIVARSLEVSGGVAIVNLPARVRTLSQETLYAMRAAIANTLTEFAQVRYVSVLVGGREEGFDLAATLPVGAMTRTADLDVAAGYDRLEQIRQSAEGFTQATVMYLPSADGRYVLPEVRAVDYAQMTPIEYLYTLLEEMGMGTSSDLVSRSIPAPMLFIEDMPEIVRTEDGAYRAIEVRFEAALDEALAAAGLSRGIYIAMLTHTLMGAVPGVEGLKVHIGSEVITGISAEHAPDGRPVAFSQVLATREDFSAYLGAPVTVYAIAQGGGGLIAEQRVLAQNRQSEPRAQLETLIAMWGDRAATAPLTGADVLAVSADGDEYAVNLSGAFADALCALDEAEAKSAVYAMVNTLTEGSRRGGVTFYFEGEQMSRTLGGVEMRGRLARNPGMVVD